MITLCWMLLMLLNPQGCLQGYEQSPTGLYLQAKLWSGKVRMSLRERVVRFKLAWFPIRNVCVLCTGVADLWGSIYMFKIWWWSPRRDGTMVYLQRPNPLWVCVCGEDTTVQWCEISAIPRVISCMCMLWKLKFDFDLYVFEHDDLDEQEDV